MVKAQTNSTIQLIALFKLIKATALIGVAAMALIWSPERLADGAERILGGFQPGRHLIDGWLADLWNLERSKEKALAIGSVLYAAIFATEGLGLWLGKRWAEWLTVVVTASFIPLEIYELVARFGPGKVAALALNIAILGYLVARRILERRRPALGTA